MIEELREKMKIIDDFVGFLDDCFEQKKFLEQQLIFIEKKRDDSLHKIELLCGNYYELAQEGLKLKEILVRRRDIKDSLEFLVQISNMYAKRTEEFRVFSNKLDKIEKKQENRKYTCRIDGEVIHNAASKKQEESMQDMEIAEIVVLREY